MCVYIHERASTDEKHTTCSLQTTALHYWPHDRTPCVCMCIREASSTSPTKQPSTTTLSLRSSAREISCWMLKVTRRAAGADGSSEGETLAAADAVLQFLCTCTLAWIKDRHTGIHRSSHRSIPLLTTQLHAVITLLITPSAVSL